jgi:hypothetical protein
MPGRSITCPAERVFGIKQAQFPIGKSDSLILRRIIAEIRYERYHFAEKMIFQQV